LSETHDRENFQGRYVLRHPWQGASSCSAAEEYHKSLPVRFAQQARNLASLTGWSANDIAKHMTDTGQAP
jgi:hypothetical protein